MLVTRSRHGGRRHHQCLVLFVACLVVCGVSPFDCSRNSTVASLKKESVFDFKTSVVENGKCSKCSATYIRPGFTVRFIIVCYTARQSKKLYT